MSLEGQIDWLVAGCYLGEARSCPLSSEAHLGVSKEFKNAWLPTAVLGTPGNLCLQHMWGSSFWSYSNMGLRLQGWSTEGPEAVALYEVAGLLTAFHLTPPKPTEKWLFAELVNSQTATGSGLLKCSPCLFVFSGSPRLYPSHMAQVMGKLHLSPPAFAACLKRPMPATCSNAAIGFWSWSSLVLVFWVYSPWSQEPAPDLPGDRTGSAKGVSLTAFHPPSICVSSFSFYKSSDFEGEFIAG